MKTRKLEEGKSRKCDFVDGKRERGDSKFGRRINISCGIMITLISGGDFYGLWI